MDKQFNFAENLKFVGILMFQEFPSTCVLQDEAGNPWIQEWIDITEEGIDQFILFRTSKVNLNQFIKGQLSHLDFISRNFCFSFEGTFDNIHNIQIVNKLPFNKLPKQNTYFNSQNGVDLNIIINTFSLDSIKNETLERLSHYGQEKNCDLINIHLNTGERVKYGSVETKYFTDILNHTDALRREIALDTFFGKNRGKKRKFNNIITTKIGTEIVILEAASFSIYLRPLSCTWNLFNTPDETEINKKFIKLLDISNDQEILKDIIDNSSSFVTNAYIDFLDTVYKEDAKFEVSFYSPFQKEKVLKNIIPQQARFTLDVIKELSTTSEEDFLILGRFFALNCETGTFKFKDSNGFTYTGSFEANLIDNMENLTFNQEYKVNIHRKKIKKPNSNKEKIEDKIFTFPEEQIIPHV
ncbi:hypothetical protein [Gabonibacter chumensis]|uniref:hypothetical protein n=1 Tax=Gabonibacter chumensis TaxID=2972474 RepID=UPI0025735CA9|nr:hypothetical protein [Gabonibacter chumensis]MCR9011974.1 hypothetical protein [Gabonibacter chumensis]